LITAQQHETSHQLAFVMAAIRSPLGSWPEIGDVPFTDIMQELALQDKIACESVCRQWRAQLRDAPAPRLWGKVVTVTNSVASAVTYLPEEPRIVLPGSDDHCLSLAAWLARRSTGVQYLRFHSAVSFNDAPDDARRMCYLLKPLRAAAKPKLILDFLGAFTPVSTCSYISTCLAELKLCIWYKCIACVVACRCVSPDASTAMQAGTPHVCGPESVCKYIR